jgi:hypothetical protein
MVVIAAVGQLAACGGAETAGGDAVPGSEGRVASAAASGAAATFDQSMSSKGCELLTPELVSTTFDAPPDKLRQIKVAGCIYTWTSDERVVEARISLLMVHASGAAATRWFENATRDMSAEQAKQQLDQAVGAVKDKAAAGEAGRGVSPSAVDTVMGGAVADGSRYGDIEGLGDEARVNLDNGSLWIRVNNLTFSVAAYNGPPNPPATRAAIDIKNIDVKKIAADAKASENAWLAQTFDERKRDAQTLARAIIARL